MDADEKATLTARLGVARLGVTRLGHYPDDVDADGTLASEREDQPTKTWTEVTR